LPRWSKQSPDARTHPTNDWKIASLLFSLWNTNDPGALFSVNQPSASASESLLDGMIVLSNLMPTFERVAPTATNFDSLVIRSNSPQAQIVADGINRARLHDARHYFKDLGDILATREVPTSSHWLDQSTEIIR